eukprot:Polyplicarium_translucidae@DN3051_c7_g1_i6.p1
MTFIAMVNMLKSVRRRSIRGTGLWMVVAALLVWIYVAYSGILNVTFVLFNILVLTTRAFINSFVTWIYLTVGFVGIGTVTVCAVGKQAWIWRALGRGAPPGRHAPPPGPINVTPKFVWRRDRSQD